MAITLSEQDKAKVREAVAQKFPQMSKEAQDAFIQGYCDKMAQHEEPK